MSAVAPPAALGPALAWIAAERGCAAAEVRELHRGRATVYGVRCADGAAYAVKLSAPASAARERRWYRTNAPVADAPSRWLDAPLGPGTLLFATDPGACDAHDYAVAHQQLPAELPGRLARELAALHARAAGDAPPARLAPASAWRTGGLAGPVAERARAVLAAGAEARELLRGDALVHADVRWENVLIGAQGRTSALIDWEDAGRGAPAWDLGCLLASYAGYLARARARAGEGEATAALGAIVRAHGASAWAAYREAAVRQRAPLVATGGFARAVVLASALRLAESALLPAGAPQPAERAALLDAAHDLLADPAGGAARWYGIRDPLV